MTNHKTTEGWAIVAKDGRVKHVMLGHHGSAGNYGSHDETVTPVTIIPTADLVREAARVLLGAMFEPDGTTYNGDFLGKLPPAPIHSIEASLRALAGQGGE